MAAQAAVRLQSTMLTLMRSTQAGQDLLDHDAGPMRQQAAARSIQRIYRKRMKERKRRHQKDATNHSPDPDPHHSPFTLTLTLTLPLPLSRYPYP